MAHQLPLNKKNQEANLKQPFVTKEAQRRLNSTHASKQEPSSDCTLFAAAAAAAAVYPLPPSHGEKRPTQGRGNKRDGERKRRSFCPRVEIAKKPLFHLKLVKNKYGFFTSSPYMKKNIGQTRAYWCISYAEWTCTQTEGIQARWRS